MDWVGGLLISPIGKYVGGVFCMPGGFWTGGDNESTLWPLDILMIEDCYSNHTPALHADAGHVTIVSIAHLDNWLSWQRLHENGRVSVQPQQFLAL